MAKGKRPRILREEERVACAGWCPDGATVERRSRMVRRGWRRVSSQAFWDGAWVWICPECAKRHLREKDIPTSDVNV